MFISQDLKSFLQLFFREEIVFIPLPLYSCILIGNCLSASAAGGTSGAGVGGRARGGKGGSTLNIAAVSVRFVKLRAATRRAERRYPGGGAGRSVRRRHDRDLSWDQALAVFSREPSARRRSSGKTILGVSFPFQDRKSSRSIMDLSSDLEMMKCFNFL
jgi:hypothetical protein